MHAGTRQNRHFQSLLLRRSSRRARPSTVLEGPKAARRPGHETYLGPALPGHQRIRRVFDSKWSSHSEILPARFKRRAKETVPRAPGGFEKELEVLHGGCQRTRLLEGLPGSIRGDDPEYGHEARAVVRGSRGQQVVYATDRGFRDYPGTRRTPSFFPRSGQGQKERAGSRPPFPARPKGVGAKEPAAVWRGQDWSGLPTLSRGQASRSTTERRTCRKAAATSFCSVQNLKSLQRNRLQVHRRRS